MPALYSDPSIEISLDSNSNILHVSWRGYQSLNTATQGCARILEMMTRHKAFRVFNDNSEARGLWMGAAEWAAREWFPMMKEAGMERFAWVYSPTKFSQISADTAVAMMDAELHGVRLFHDRSEALAWLSNET